ncbi:hypothetical protein K8I84_05860 [Marinobacter sp. F4216]|nr:hypothetical protein [Marinobacter sp. F4216]
MALAFHRFMPNSHQFSGFSVAFPGHAAFLEIRELALALIPLFRSISLSLALIGKPRFFGLLTFDL